MENIQQKRVVTVPVARVYEIKDKLNKLIKRAIKLGLEPPKLVVGQPKLIEKTRIDEFGELERFTVEVVEIDVVGEMIKLPGYTLVAHIEHEKTGNFLYVKPGKVLDPKYRTTENFCEHCKTARDRKNLYVFDTPDGTQMQVGKNCLRDFMGVDPKAVMFAAEFEKTLGEYEEEGWGGGGKGFFVALEILLKRTRAVIEHEGGYVSMTAARAAGDEAAATAHHVQTALFPNWKDEHELKYARKISAIIKENEVDYDESAKACINFIVNAWNNDTDYAWNIKAIAKQGAVTEAKRMSFALSMWPAYVKEMGRLKEKELAAKKQAALLANSAHQGTEKDRLKNVKVNVLQAAFMGQSQWGDKYLYKFLDDAGNVYVWWTTGGKHLDKGDEVIINGTVKGHKEYKGVKETQLGRVTVVEKIKKVA